MKIGLFFGSFNPVHVGHMIIANFMLSYTDIDELWFIVSPQNPLKEKESLVEDSLRLEMLQIAVSKSSNIKVSNVEFALTKPSFTIHTLDYLASEFPSFRFVIIMGADGLTSFTKWKDYQLIEQNYERYIYPRPGFECFDSLSCKNCQFQPAPLLEISSTFIRNALKENKDIRFFLPAGVYDYIRLNSLYI